VHNSLLEGPFIIIRPLSITILQLDTARNIVSLWLIIRFSKFVFDNRNNTAIVGAKNHNFN